MNFNEWIKKYTENKDELKVSKDQITLLFNVYYDNISSKKVSNNLLYAQKNLNNGDYLYKFGTGINEFINNFNKLCNQYIYLDTKKLKRLVFQYLSHNVKNGNLTKIIKQRTIANELVKYNLDDEFGNNNNLSKTPLNNLLISQSNLEKMIKASISFEEEKFKKTSLYQGMANTYQRIQRFIKDELIIADKLDDIKHKRNLELLNLYYKDLLLPRIKYTKKMVLNDDKLYYQTYYYNQEIDFGELLNSDIMNELKLFAAKIEISPIDVYQSIEEYHIYDNIINNDNYFEGLINQDKEKLLNSNFSLKFTKICSKICRKKDGKSYTVQEIQQFLMKQFDNYKKEYEKELKQDLEEYIEPSENFDEYISSYIDNDDDIIENKNYKKYKRYKRY